MDLDIKLVLNMFKFMAMLIVILWPKTKTTTQWQKGEIIRFYKGKGNKRPPGLIAPLLKFCNLNGEIIYNFLL